MRATINFPRAQILRKKLKKSGCANFTPKKSCGDFFCVIASSSGKIPLLFHFSLKSVGIDQGSREIVKIRPQGTIGGKT